VSTVFADTSFFLALLNVDDLAHRRALDQLQNQHAILTTEFILLELGNACARAEDHADFLTLVRAVKGSPRSVVLPLDSALLDRGLQLMAERTDKNWSLTDCISFVVMTDRGIRGALTADRHFQQAGFETLLAT
jgi:predicted nucleic acid-binding protein